MCLLRRPRASSRRERLVSREKREETRRTRARLGGARFAKRQKRSFDIEIPVPVALPDIPFRTERQSYFFSRESHRNPGKGTSTETGDPISGCDVRDGRRIYRGRGRWCDRVDPSFGFFRRPQSRSAYPKLYKYVVRKNRVAMRPRRSTLSLTQLALASQTRACPRGGIRTPPQTPPSSLSGHLVVVFDSPRSFAHPFSSSFRSAWLGSTRLGFDVDGVPLHSVPTSTLFTPPRYGGS